MSAVRIDPKKKETEIKSLCAEIVQRIKNQEDPLELNEFRSFMKKNVPFFMRSYFAAFLLKQLYEAVPGTKDRPQFDRKRRGEARAEPRAEAVSSREPAISSPSRREDSPRREDPPRRSLPEAEAATLFVGVGRNRRAYARDLLPFITISAEIDADAVGELRVLDNFSFVQVKKEVAETVIERLNGKEFRGRTVSVSYAKPRKEESREEGLAEPATVEDPGAEK